MRYWLLLLCGWSVLSWASAIDPYPFDDPRQAAEFRALAEELRCVVCQNQSLADSNAELAKDLRREVYLMLRAGQSGQEIKAFMVERYGDFVLYRPPIKPATWILWFGPLGCFVVVVIGLGLAYKKRRRAATSSVAALNDVERARLAQLLDADKESE